jgi:hypothetical protein
MFFWQGLARPTPQRHAGMMLLLNVPRPSSAELLCMLVVMARQGSTRGVLIQTTHCGSTVVAL